MDLPFVIIKPGLNRALLGWYLFFRVLLVSLFVGGTIFYLLRGFYGTLHPSLPYLYSLLSIYYLQALVFSALLRNIKRLRVLIHLQVVWDLMFAAALIYFTGCIESHFSFLNILIIFGVSLLLSRRETFAVASASAILYGSLLDLQYYGYLPQLGGALLPEVVDGRDVFYAVFVNVVAYFLVGLLGGVFSERLRKSEQALERRKIDYEELEQLNRIILSHIGSGLMILNAAGRIRAFNRAAEKIIGLTLRDVYNRNVSEILPDLLLYDNGLQTYERGEGPFLNAEGDERILGYSAALLPERQNEGGGLLVSFQDLTHLRHVEARLQQSDRLAAVGKMASGMAHEIRNPLASISGSLQLLVEGGEVAPEGERLAQIVVREAERLSTLISDFLTYARPAQPLLSKVDIAQLCDELIEMAKTDERLMGINVICDYPQQTYFRVDVGQIHQVLWNLLLNAAEAMTGGGTVRIALEPDNGLIVIEDSGPGISEGEMKKIFDPFYSTKTTGTGLGLATVYAMLESHGARVDVMRSELGGARFELRLPVEPAPSPRGETVEQDERTARGL